MTGQIACGLDVTHIVILNTLLALRIICVPESKRQLCPFFKTFGKSRLKILKTVMQFSRHICMLYTPGISIWSRNVVHNQSYREEN